MTMKTLALVSCVKTKLSHPAKAKDIYTSDLFKKARNYVEINHDEWMIMSALHCLVHPEQEINPYEFTLIGQAKKDRMRWAEDVHLRIKQEYSTDNIIYMYAGELYRQFLQPLLVADGFQVIVPLKGLMLGEQKAWFKKELSG